MQQKVSETTPKNEPFANTIILTSLWSDFPPVLIDEEAVVVIGLR